MSGLAADPGRWLAGSLFVAVLATNLAGLALHAPDKTGRRGGLRASAAGPLIPALSWLLVALYMLLPPFGAWRTGAVSPHLMGLTEIDGLATLGAPGMLAITTSLVALAAWLIFRRSLRLTLAGQPSPARISLPQSDVVDGQRVRSWLTPVDAGLYQWHAAFYRAIAIGWLAAGAILPAGLPARLPLLAGPASALLQTWRTQPVYWGSWLGLLLLALEWAANPFARRALRVPGRMEGAMRAVGMAVATTALFSLTRNFWLCLGCALAVEIAIAWWFPPEAWGEGAAQNKDQEGNPRSLAENSDHRAGAGRLSV